MARWSSMNYRGHRCAGFLWRIDRFLWGLLRNWSQHGGKEVQPASEYRSNRPNPLLVPNESHFKVHKLRENINLQANKKFLICHSGHSNCNIEDYLFDLTSTVFNFLTLFQEEVLTKNILERSSSSYSNFVFFRLGYSLVYVALFSLGCSSVYTTLFTTHLGDPPHPPRDTPVFLKRSVFLMEN